MFSTSPSEIWTEEEPSSPDRSSSRWETRRRRPDEDDTAAAADCPWLLETRRWRREEDDEPSWGYPNDETLASCRVAPTAEEEGGLRRTNVVLMFLCSAASRSFFSYPILRSWRRRFSCAAHQGRVRFSPGPPLRSSTLQRQNPTSPPPPQHTTNRIQEEGSDQPLVDAADRALAEISHCLFPIRIGIRIADVRIFQVFFL